MSNTFWIDDLAELNEALAELNKRLGIDPEETEEAVTLMVDGDFFIISGQKMQKDETKWKDRVNFKMVFDMDFQTVDEVAYTLKRLLGMQ